MQAVVIQAVSIRFRVAEKKLMQYSGASNAVIGVQLSFSSNARSTTRGAHTRWNVL